MAAVGEVEELPNGRLESVSVEASELSDARAVVSVDGSVLSSRSFKVNDNLDNDPASYEKFLLGEDSYWDDLGVRLKVLRLVSDSVIKGMVNAVAEEAAEKIALKEEELGLLHDRLQSYETDAAKFNRLESLQMMPDHLTMEVVPQRTKSELQNRFLDASVEHDCTEHLHTLEIMLEEQLQSLGDDLKSATNLDSHCRVNGCSSDVRMGSILPRGNATEELLKIDESIDAFRATLSAAFKQINDMFFPMKASICEHQWKDEFQREVSTIMIRSYIKDLHNDFAVKLWEQKNPVRKLKENWQKRFAELSAMRQELDAVSKSLCSSEQGLLLSHSSHDFEEWNSGKRKDHMPWKVLGNHHLLFTSCPEENGTILAEASIDSPRPMLEVAEPPQLRSMTKEEVIAYYISEMIKMRRQHDLVLQEKTEELFSLKREFLKEKGSSPFRKDREFEFLKKRIPDILSKLDGILLDSEKLPSVNNNQEELCSLKNKIDTLFFENQHLRGLLTDKRKEVMCLSSQVSDAASQMSLHSSEEASFIRQIKKLKWDVKDMMIEAYMREELHKDIFRDVVNKHRDILRDFVGEHKSVMEDLEIQNNIVQEVFSILFRGVVDDVMATINPVMLEHDVEKASLEAVLLEKEKALCLEVEEKEKLKQDITSLLEEKENFASVAGSTLMQQEQQFDLVRQELIMLRDKVKKQDIMILEKKVELDSVKARLVQTLQKINQYEINIERLNHKNRIIWESLEEAEKENTTLHSIIEEKQSALESSNTKEKEQEKATEYIANSVTGLSKAVADFENRLAEILGGHEHRLDGLSHQCDQLFQQANLLKKKGALYKHILDIKCSNLQKAETEVDLLGDEVDALLSLLGKIYIALDHYSPVLQHYPGVMEILKLVQRELKGENNELM